MIKNVFASAAFGAALTLSACGGGGGVSQPGDGSGNNPPPPPNYTQYRVTGPMDAVQTPVSDQVFGQLEDATDGTPLKAVLICANDLVTFDALDIVDTLANALQNSGPSNAAAQLTAAQASLTASVAQLANDLQGLLGALAAQGAGCGSNGQPSGTSIGQNPLTSTPLAPLGNELKVVLPSIQQYLGNAGTNPQSLAFLATLVTQLSNAVTAGNSGIASFSSGAEILNSTFVGGTLVTVQQTLADLANLLSAAAALNPDSVKTQINGTLSHALNYALIKILPLQQIDAQGGSPGALSGPVTTQAAAIATLFASNLQLVSTNSLKAALTNGFVVPTVDPLSTDVIPVLADDLLVALSHYDPASGPTFTLLDGALGAVATLLGPVGGSGQPVQSLLDEIVDTINLGGTCSLLGTILSGICGP